MEILRSSMTQKTVEVFLSRKRLVATIYDRFSDRFGGRSCGARRRSNAGGCRGGNPRLGNGRLSSAFAFVFSCSSTDPLHKYGPPSLDRVMGPFCVLASRLQQPEKFSRPLVKGRLGSSIWCWSWGISRQKKTRPAPGQAGLLARWVGAAVVRCGKSRCSLCAGLIFDWVDLTRSQAGFEPRMTCESSRSLNRHHSSYLCPLWRFLRQIG